MVRGLFLIIFIISIRTSSCVIEALYKAGQQVWILHRILEIWAFEMSYDVEYPNDKAIIQELEKRQDKIHEQLNQLEKFIGPKKIVDAIKSWQINALFLRDIDIIEIFVQRIDEYYERFHQYRNNTHRSNALLEVLRHEIFQTLPEAIGTIRTFAYERHIRINEEDAGAAIAGFARARVAETCGAPRITSNILIQLFRMIIIAELKTSAMLVYENTYGYMMNEDKQGRRNMNTLAKEKLEEQFALYVNIFSSNIAVVDVVYNRACDPVNGKWIRGESFYELRNNVRPILFHYNSSRCRLDSCNSVIHQGEGQCRLTVYGKISGMSSDYANDECVGLGHIEACLLNSGPFRFQYVNSAELGFLGKNKSCPTDNGRVIEISTVPPGSNTACQCSVYSSQNKISLLQTDSNVDSNRVITGLRFVRIEKVLHIQVREGELRPNGYINESSQSWIHIYGNVHSAAIVPISNENRVFFLDDLILPSGFVLTGIKFNRVRRQNVTGFAIEIFGTRFNYTTGIVSVERHLTQSRRESNAKSGKHLPFMPVSSVFTTKTHTVTPSDRKYVILRASRLKEDFGQSTLPLFDAVPITVKVPSALGGVGIFHKGVLGYAGLISLRVYGIQHVDYFNYFKSSRVINERVLFNSSLYQV